MLNNNIQTNLSWRVVFKNVPGIWVHQMANNESTCCIAELYMEISTEAHIQVEHNKVSFSITIKKQLASSLGIKLMTYSSHNSQEHAMELKDNGQIRSIIYPLNIAFKPSMSCRSAVWFLFPFPAAHQSLSLGIISRVARLKTTVGPNWNKFTVTHGRQW